MQHTNGCISWRRLAEQIAGGEKNVQPIGPDALSEWVMGTEGFRYTETQTLPQCTTERTEKTDLDELQIIAGDFGDTDYDNFTDEQKERYNEFGKAFEEKIAADYPDVVPPYPGNE